MGNKTKEERKNKILGAMMGGAIGDALGYQIEFKRNIKEKEITSFKEGIGRISDDTQMTLFTANALLFRETRQAMIIRIIIALYLGLRN